MKKIIAKTLITALISNNAVYTDNINNKLLDINSNVEVVESIEDIDIIESIENKSSALQTKNKAIIIQEDVDDFDSLKKAVEKSDIEINIKKNIVLQDSINITGTNVTINGGGFTLDLNQTNPSDTSSRFEIKSNDVVINNLKVKNYLTNGISVYRASGIELNSIELIGIDKSVTDKNELSKVGIDINQSNVKVGDITSSNHLYRGIQVRGGSTVEITSKNIHDNDTVHMQTIKNDGESDNKIVDSQNSYLIGTEKVNDNKTTVDYFLKRDVEITTAQDLINNISNNGNVLHVRNNIKLDASNLPQGDTKIELVVSSNILIEGNGNTLDLNDIGNLTLKGNDIHISNLTVKNAEDIGINIYNSRDIVLNKVTVQDSERYGIFVNGSTVELEDCSTLNNNGGIMITRSRTLKEKNHIDSVVKVIGSIKQEESNINVKVTNLQMLDNYFQNNQFIVVDNVYDKYVNDIESKVLSDYYLNLFGITGDDRNKKYDKQTIDYMMVKTVIDVKNNAEVLDANGQPVTLMGDGVTDDTENLKTLIKYAASHGRDLYFPEGIYKITDDIDLATINLPALSNFTLSGSTNGLVIFDGSSSADRMLKIFNAEYHSYMNYININNIVFNNIGLEFNGPYKKGISIENNVFMNGKYTRETNAAGEIRKVTMEPYITVKNSKYIIEKNAFLRGENYPGRGIATYRTNNTTIKDNFFGRLEGLSDAKAMLPNTVIDKLSLIEAESQSGLSDEIKIKGSQGNFHTAINNERYDENVTISNNYFNMEKTRNIIGDFGTDVLISGINVAQDGQRRDHIIYSKGYNNLNIVGNYFEGMENGAAGGVKIRNGKNAYVGANHFKDVPLLTYIYGDLTQDECVLYDTTIYNNLFHQTTNFGQTGTGILYYQSYKDGDDLTFGNETWLDAYGDVKNFVIYNNEFMSDDRDQITISNRAKTAYAKNEFVAYGNRYAENKNISVNYDSGNLSLKESTEAEVLSKVNSGFTQHNAAPIPLTPVSVDYKQLNTEIDEANDFYNQILSSGQIGILGGLYSETVANELKNLLLETEQLINSNSLTQWETNKRLTLIKETLEKLKVSINTKGEAPEITGIGTITIEVGDTFDAMDGVVITDDRDTIDQMIISVDLGNFDNNTEGEYIISYRIKDRDGNETIVERKVLVVEDNKLNESENPKTGDQNNILIWLLTGIISIMAIIFITKNKKKVN